MTQSNTEELKAARSATTGENFDTLDERIDCEVDRLNKKIEVSMLQQEDKESHTIENTVEGMSTDMVIKGRTLFNHVGKYLKHAGCDWDDNKVTVSGIPLNDGYSINFEGTAIDINKSYIIGIYIESLNDNAKNLGFSMGVLDNTGSAWNKVELITPVKGWNFVELAFDKSKTLGNIRFRNSKPPTDLELNIVFTNFIMIEKINKYSFIDNPCYFKDFKSFGQQEDKISILSNNKNLFKSYEELISVKKGQQLYLSSKLTDGCTRIDIQIDNQTDITVSDIMYWREAEKVYRLSSDRNKLGISLAVNRDCNIKLTNKYLKVKEYEDIQLEEGTQSTSYEPYKCDKKDILLQDLGFDEGLRGFDLTICDELNDIKNVAIKKIEKYICNGNENLRVIDASLANCLAVRFSLENIKADTRNVLCNNFYHELSWNDKEHFFIERSSITFIINKTKLISQDVEGFKAWLKANPTAIYYELAEPVEIPLSENINLKTFREKTYIGFENSISGTSSFKAPVDAAATISRLNRENRALEEENKNLRQDFESTTLTLTDSDLELVKQNVDMDFRLMEVEFALDIPQAILSSDIKFKNKKGEVKSMARTPYEMMKIVILSGDYDREDYIHKVGKYYERGRMTKEEHDELMSLMTADEVISK